MTFFRDFFSCDFFSYTHKINCLVDLLPGFSRRGSVILAHARNSGIMYANMISYHTSRSEQRLFKKGFLITCPHECHDGMFYECENHTF